MDKGLTSVVLALASATFIGAATGTAQCAPQWSFGGANGMVDHLVSLASGDVVAAGSFTVIEGVPANGVALYDGTSWASLGGGVIGITCEPVQLPGGDLVAATGAGLARWNGTSWQPFAPAPTYPVRSLAALPNGDVAALGTGCPGPQSCTALVELWDGTSWQVIGTAVGPATAQVVIEVAGLGVLPSGELVAAGDWNAMLPAGGQPGFYNEIVRWDGTSWHHLGEEPRPQTLLVKRDGTVVVGSWYSSVSFYNVSGPVAPCPCGADQQALAVLPDGDVVVGGALHSPAGPTPGPGAGLTRCGALGGQSSQLGAALGTALPSYVRAMAFHGSGELVVGGTFAPGLAYLATPCPALAGSVSTTCTGPVGAMTLTATDLPWIDSTFRSESTGFAAGSLGLAVVGLGVQQVPLATIHPAGLPACLLSVTSDAVALTVPTAGRSSYSFAVPNEAALVGVLLHHQFLQGELGPQGALVSLSSSNRLDLTVGAF